MNGQQGGPPFGGRPGAPPNAAWGAQTPGYPQQQQDYPQQQQQQQAYPQAQHGYPPQPPQGGYAQPPQAYGQPPQAQQPGYGQPPPHGYGAQAPAYPQAPAAGAPPNYGAPRNYGGGAGGYGVPGGGYAPMQSQAGAPERSWAAVDPKKGAAAANFPPVNPVVAAKEIGLFGAVPCPACGAATHTGSVGGIIASQAAGLVGRLLYSAIAAKYICPTHGEIPRDAFPAHHRNAIDMRRFLKLGVAGALLLLVFALLIVRARFLY